MKIETSCGVFKLPAKWKVSTVVRLPYSYCQIRIETLLGLYYIECSSIKEMEDTYRRIMQYYNTRLLG